MAGRPKSTQIQYGQLKAAQLRQSILQAAVQGKLVPQNLHDEPASALLECIKREKAKLIKDGEIRKEKPLPPITEEEIPYDLPDGWLWCRLGEIATFVDYGTSTKTHSQTEGVPILRMGNIQNGVLNFENLKYASKQNVDLPWLYLSSGDLLFNRTNSFELVGKSAVFEGRDREFSFASYLIRVKFFCTEPNFISTYINSDVCRKTQIEPNATQQNGQANFNGSKLKNIILPLPPLDEQQRIVAKVDELMALCDELEAAEKELDALEANFADYLPKSILQAAVQGKLVPQNLHDEPASVLLERIKAEKVKLIKEGKFKKEKPLPPITEEEAPCDLPYGWMWCRLGDIGVWKSGATPQRGTATYYSNGTIPWLKTGELNDAEIYDSEEKITESALRECSLSINHPDSLLLAMYGATIGKLGILKVAAATNQACCACSFFAGIKLKYAYYYLLSLRDELRKQGYGGAQPNISKEKIVVTYFPLPPFAEQQRIVAKVDELMTLCNELKKIDATIPLPPLELQGSSPVKTAMPVMPPPAMEERYGIAARGEVSEKLSDKHRSDRHSIFEDDA